MAAAPRARISAARSSARRGRQALLTPQGIGGAAFEAAWTAAHIATYAFGATKPRDKNSEPRDVTRLDHLPPVTRGLLIGDVEAAGTPIVLVHGLLDNRSIFGPLKRQLRRRGFGKVVCHSYSVRTHDVETAALRLAQAVERLCEETGFERVHVIGHSLGGLVARWYVQKMNGDARVHTLITLGSPHAGSKVARIYPTFLGKQLLPGSAIYQALEEPCRPIDTRFVAVWSDLDTFVVPQRNARIDHPDLNARNVFLRGAGHLSLPMNARVVREIVATLAHLDHDGCTVTAGVTSLASTRHEQKPAAASTARKKRAASSAS
ncbi:MAG TPA: alpha/beta fold hydrolase [Mycobacteriales bacterium]|nr:alpha/beta fold hydrolase [Mycobacteriales bacterium]